MSPQPVPTKRRAATVHYSNKRNGTLCGAKGARKKVEPATFATTCPVCSHIAYEMDLYASERNERRRATIDSLARLAYDVWAHRAVHGAPPAFDQLPGEQRDAWYAVALHFEPTLASVNHATA
jgi:hypothetical protein